MKKIRAQVGQFDYWYCPWDMSCPPFTGVINNAAILSEESAQNIIEHLRAQHPRLKLLIEPA